MLSEFPFEEERFIFHSYVSIKDIVINGLHHDQWLKIFRFWYKLKEGFFFDHLIGTMGVTKNDQLCICAMIINMMLGKENENHSKYDQRIPYYMQCLFNECIQNKAFVWIIESEYLHLAPKLKSLLFYNSTNLNKSSQFIRFLVSEKNVMFVNVTHLNGILLINYIIHCYMEIMSGLNLENIKYICISIKIMETHIVYHFILNVRINQKMGYFVVEFI